MSLQAAKRITCMLRCLWLHYGLCPMLTCQASNYLWVSSLLNMPKREVTATCHTVTSAGQCGSHISWGWCFSFRPHSVPQDGSVGNQKVGDSSHAQALFLHVFAFPTMPLWDRKFSPPELCSKLIRAEWDDYCQHCRQHNICGGN